ncbi:MAG: ATP-dependent zinc protease family protein [Thermodesulfobacteriota bacterium]
MINKKEKLIIGRKDKVDFPKLKLFNIDAKIDSGAFTSAIHCNNIRIKRRGEKRFVYFNLLDHSHPDYNHKEIRLPLHKIKMVKNSFGHSERRYIVLTDIILFDQKYEIELSLSDRTKMLHPVLLGRKLLKKEFIVDVSRVNLSYRQKMRKMN